MRVSRSQIAGAVLIGVALAGRKPADAQLWRHFLPTSIGGASADNQLAPSNAPESHSVRKVDYTELADSSGAVAINSEYALTQDKGPWLIVATSFSGTGAEKQAQDLAKELRSRYGMPPTSMR